MNTSKNTTESLLLRKIRRMVLLFMALLVLSGITAFPVQTELHWMMQHAGSLPDTLAQWLARITAAVDDTAGKYPYLIYGYDWLAYAHIIIALFFTGVYRDPIRNAWVLRIGMIACAGVFILAFSCAQIRGIPLFWTLVDCSFGFFGIIPLIIVQRWINQLENIHVQKFTNSPHTL